MGLTVWLNGQERTLTGVEDGADLASCVAELGLTPDRIAVELNGEIARRHAWSTAEVRAGDKLEVVHFVGGGSSCNPGCHTRNV
jgi:thiamine biosynthesis protein ThiS